MVSKRLCSATQAGQHVGHIITCSEACVHGTHAACKVQSAIGSQKQCPVDMLTKAPYYEAH